MNNGDEMTTATRDEAPLLDAIGAEPAALPPRIVVAEGAAASPTTPAGGTPKVSAENVNIFYGPKLAVRDVTLDVPEKSILALIGPSGSGKSTFLRCFNRMHDLTPGTRYEGNIMLLPEEMDLVSRGIDPIEVRMRIGMVFQKPNPFPKSIYENVAYGLRIRGVRSHLRIQEEVERALRWAALWDEVKDRLSGSALSLSDSSSVCASRARSLPARKSCCSTNRPPHSIRSPPPASRSSSPRCASRSRC